MMLGKIMRLKSAKHSAMSRVALEKKCAEHFLASLPLGRGYASRRMSSMGPVRSKECQKGSKLKLVEAALRLMV